MAFGAVSLSPPPGTTVLASNPPTPTPTPQDSWAIDVGVWEKEQKKTMMVIVMMTTTNDEDNWRRCLLRDTDIRYEAGMELVLRLYVPVGGGGGRDKGELNQIDRQLSKNKRSEHSNINKNMF